MRLDVKTPTEQSVVVSWSVSGIDVSTITALHRTLESEVTLDYKDLSGKTKGQ